MFGHHGVGKTKLAHSVAVAGMKRREESASPECHVLELNLGALLSTTKGTEDVVSSLIKFLKANREMTLFVDGMYSLLALEEGQNEGAGNVGGGY